MKDKEIIELPDGRECVTTATAAKRLKVIKRRVLHFLEEKRLESVQLEEGGKHYILLNSLEAFQKVERKRGRPSKAAATKGAGAKKAAKKKVQKDKK